MELTIDKINEIEGYCWRSALVLELQKAFGLRRKEAFLLQPHLADQGVFLDLTERGRWLQDEKPRVVNIETKYQREILDKAKRLITNPTGRICGDGLRELKRAYDRYSKVMKKFGVTEATTYNLRHQFANDKYERMTAETSPAQMELRDEKNRSTITNLQISENRIYKDGQHIGFIDYTNPLLAKYCGKKPQN